MLLSILALISGPSFAEDSENLLQDRETKREQLKALNESITKVRSWFKKAEKEQSTLTKKLRTTELKISDNLRQRQKLEAGMESIRKEISRLSNEETRQQQALIQHQTLLKQQLRAAHAMGHEQGIRLIFDAEDPVNLQRFLTYYDYMNRARSRKIEKSRRLIANLQQIRLEINSENQKLIDSKHELAKNQQVLKAEREKRAEALAALEGRLENKRLELARMEDDQQQLELLLRKIEQALSNVAEPSESADFERLRGQLIWPTVGELAEGFGASHNNGLHSTGIFLKTEKSESVKAIYQGRVIFADWLRGFGLLLIVDHGDDYMSLYGFNQALLKDTGDWVASNEVIASTGTSGGQSQTGLYFEIRHKGKPSDPLDWLIKNNSKN